MGKKPNDTDSASVRIEKKSKKNKNITSDIDVGVPKEKSHKHKEKKRKSESIEDGDEDRHDKGNLVNNGDLQKKDKKKKRKRDSSDPAQIEEDEPGQTDGADLERDYDQKSQSQKSNDGEVNDKGNLGNDGDLQKKDKKKKRKRDSSHTAQIEENEPAQNGGTNLERDSDPKSQSQSLITEGRFETNSTNEKKKKKKKKTDVQNSNAETNGIMTEGSNMEDSQDGKGKKVEVKVKGSKVKKKTTESESLENNTEKPKAKKTSKKVSFSGHVEVFPTSDTDPEKQKTKTDGLIRGKRFTPEEDAIVKQAVLNYITAHDLGDEGLNMVLNCKSYPGMKKCWQEIGTCIPYRPYGAVYHRGHALFEKGEKWTPEEIESLKELHDKYGNNWKEMGAELGKHRFRVKDMWRRIKFVNIKKGKWSQDEYQNLYDLVNLDLQMKLNSEKKSKHGMLRDNIPWTAISDKLTTRNDATCCMKWYRQLTSSLVVENKWSDADDYRMIGVLYELDATCAEDVDWDNVLEHRPGDICRKRWDQMVKHIGHQGSKPFVEQVDILATRYCPDLAETREANKLLIKVCVLFSLLIRINSTNMC